MTTGLEPSGLARSELALIRWRTAATPDAVLTWWAGQRSLARDVDTAADELAAGAGASRRGARRPGVSAAALTRARLSLAGADLAQRERRASAPGDAPRRSMTAEPAGRGHGIRAGGGG